MNYATKEFDTLSPPEDCPECGGAGYLIIKDSELGDIMTGCGTCWVYALENDPEYAARA